MELIRGIHNLRNSHRGCAATIGNFDGVHLGHAAVIGQLVAVARARALPTCVALFEPQPQEFLTPAKAPPRLMSLREKYLCLRALGVQRLLVLAFNAALARKEPETFIEEVLVAGLGVRHLIVGDDFRFGRARRGDMAMLRAAGARDGFEVSTTATRSAHGERISSTRIRDLLTAGELATAATLLGRPYRIVGRVRYGQRLAHTLGFPTANVGLGRCNPPLRGVFAVRATRAGAEHAGVANLGTRPTVDGSRLVLEVQLFDFDADIYGERLAITFHHKLREEKKFDSLEALRAQVARDARAARDYFAARAP